MAENNATNDELIWWSKEGWATVHALPALVSFEDSVFREFSQAPPAETISLSDWANNDGQNVVEMFGWLSWPRVIGERLNGLIDTFYLGPSVQAHIYYTPAYMLHSLWLRLVEHQEVLELFLPPDDLVVLSALSGLRSGPDGADPKYFGHYMDRNAEFRNGFSAPQCEVIRQFLRLIVPWEYLGPHRHHRDRIESSVKEALGRLLRYWA